MDIPQLMQLATKSHQAGDLARAERLYRQVLHHQPGHSNALHLLGVIAAQREHHDEAITLIQQAITRNPQIANFHNSLGNVFYSQKQFRQAQACYQRVIQLEPHFFEAYNNLGNVLRELGELAQARVCYEQALQLHPKFPEAYHNLGLLLSESHQAQAAIECWQRALQLNPNFSGAAQSLGNLLKKQGNFAKALEYLQQGLASNPQSAEFYNEMGSVWYEQGNLAEAIGCFQQALLLKPHFVLALNNLGAAFTAQQRLTEAIDCFQRAFELDSQAAVTSNNLATALRHRGQLTLAVHHYQQALTLDPQFTIAHQNLLYTFNFLSEYSTATIFHYYKNFNDHCTYPLQAHLNSRDLHRKLKIAYVSPDFRRHSVAYFILPILAQHDHQRFEIFCYYNATQIDQTTQRCQSYADHWVACARFSDEELCQHIRGAQIDILVDLAGHTAGNRLLTLARKPAPLQVTYLGYPNTTGLTTIDYRLTDHYVDCEGVNDLWTVERPLKLPGSFVCYQPDSETPPVNELPVFQNGYLTFVCLNNYAKFSCETLAMWSDLLQQLSDAKLLIKSTSFKDEETKTSCLERFANLGIAPQRLILITSWLSEQAHLATYHQADLALDTYPYHGTTTTCEALWMGVPVVTLLGERYASRIGLSILSTLGLTELVAATPDEYVKIVLKLANNLVYLQKLRKELRQRMQTSPLLDAVTFTRHLESTYLNIWERWCT